MARLLQRLPSVKVLMKGLDRVLGTYGHGWSAQILNQTRCDSLPAVRMESGNPVDCDGLLCRR